MQTHHEVIRATFTNTVTALAHGACPPRAMTPVEASIPRFAKMWEAEQAEYEAAMRDAQFAAFDAAVEKAAALLRTTDANVIIAAVRRSGIAYRNGTVIFH